MSHNITFLVEILSTYASIHEEIYVRDCVECYSHRFDQCNGSNPSSAGSVFLRLEALGRQACNYRSEEQCWQTTLTTTFLEKSPDLLYILAYNTPGIQHVWDLKCPKSSCVRDGDLIIAQPSQTLYAETIGLVVRL